MIQNQLFLFLDFELFASPERHLQASDLSGEGQRGIFIIYEVDEAETERLAYLKKILAAAKIDIDKDVSALSLVAGSSMHINTSIFDPQVQYILLFGVDPKQLCFNFQIPLYKPISYQNITFLRVDAIGTIQQERIAGNNKKAGALWLALKQIFLPSA